MAMHISQCIRARSHFPGQLLPLTPSNEAGRGEMDSKVVEKNADSVQLQQPVKDSAKLKKDGCQERTVLFACIFSFHVGTTVMWSVQSHA